MKRYFKPRSMTFWAGVASLSAGVSLGVHEAQPLGWIMDAVANVLGPASSPSLLITQGLGLIGIRRKLDDLS